MRTLPSTKGQGAMEYLLIIGGIILLATITLTYLALTSSEAGDITGTSLNSFTEGVEGGSFGACGNQVLESGEQCERIAGVPVFASGTADCGAWGYYYSGTNVSCDLATCKVITSACTYLSVCGNNLAEPTEACDGTDLAGESCVSLGFASGTLSCAFDCSDFDTSACIPPVCGNGIKETGESCDDGDVDSGDGCSSVCLVENGWSCSAGNPSVCNTVCGDSILAGTEVCDSDTIACTNLGYPGTQTCNATCSGYGTCTVTEYCGDGIKNGPEQCDGNDYGGPTPTCTTLGYSGGTSVSCNMTNLPDICMYNTSGCYHSVLFQAESATSLGLGLISDSTTYPGLTVIKGRTGCSTSNNTSTYAPISIPGGDTYKFWVKADMAIGFGSLPVTLTTSNAGPITVQVPVAGTIDNWFESATFTLPVGAENVSIQQSCNTNLRVDAYLITSNLSCIPSGTGINCR